MFLKSYIPNLLSLSRIISALFFLVPSYNSFRSYIIVYMAITDFLDGFLARKWGVTSRIGTLLDPIADKIAAALMVISFYVDEPSLSLGQILSLFTRDLSLLLFYLYLQIRGGWREWNIRSFYSGKIVTALQFCIFFLLSLHVAPSSIFYALTAACGAFSFIELVALSAKNGQKNDGKENKNLYR